MTVSNELIDRLLADYKKPEDLIGENGLLKQRTKQLADDGPDTISNAVALCPNCHREIHYGINAKQLVQRLYADINRLDRS